MKTFALIALLASLAASAYATTSVVNGDFQTGTFAGWTKSGNPDLSDIIANNVTSNTTYVWRDGATGSEGFISQVLNTDIGATYQLAFDVFNSATTNALFEADFNGIKVAGFTNEVHNWTHYTISNLVATSTSTELKFGARNDPSFIRLDNITITETASATPEPGTVGLTMTGLGIIGLLSKRRLAGLK